MARYALPTDITDPALVVTATHLALADSEVDGDLRALGLTAAEIGALTLPNAQLTALAVAYACRQAAQDGSQGADSPLQSRVADYERLARQRAARLTRAALGLAAPVGGYGTVELLRG